MDWFLYDNGLSHERVNDPNPSVAQECLFVLESHFYCATLMQIFEIQNSY